MARQRFYSFATSPTSSDGGNLNFRRGDQWLNTATNQNYTCRDATPGAAVWDAMASDTTTVLDRIVGSDTDFDVTGQAAPTSTSAGGEISHTGAAGGATSGAGGAITDIGGAGTAGNSAGGAIVHTGGAGSGTTAGGAIADTSGAGDNGTSGTAGASGDIDIAAGAAGTATTGTGGAGGGIGITGVAGGVATGAAGIGGKGSTTTISGGDGGAATDASSGVGGDGGDVVLGSGDGGASTGSTAGAAGNVISRGQSFVQKKLAQTMGAAATISDSDMLSGLIVGTPTADPSNYTTHTGADLSLLFGAVPTVGDSFELTIINIAATAKVIDLVAGASGMTITGESIIENVTDGVAAGLSASGTFIFVNTAADTWIAYRK